MSSTIALWVVFWALVVLSGLVAAQIFIPAVRTVVKNAVPFLLPPAIFCALGLCLIVLALRGTEVGQRKTFLLITGLSAVGLIIFIVLHNVFYGVGQLAAGTPVLSHAADALHVAFFLAATIACPLGFAVGASVSIVLLIMKLR